MITKAPLNSPNLLFPLILIIVTLDTVHCIGSTILVTIFGYKDENRPTDREACMKTKVPFFEGMI